MGQHVVVGSHPGFIMGGIFFRKPPSIRGHDHFRTDSVGDMGRLNHLAIKGFNLDVISFADSGFFCGQGMDLTNRCGFLLPEAVHPPVGGMQIIGALGAGQKQRISRVRRFLRKFRKRGKSPFFGHSQVQLHFFGCGLETGCRIFSKCFGAFQVSFLQNASNVSPDGFSTASSMACSSSNQYSGRVSRFPSSLMMRMSGQQFCGGSTIFFLARTMP